MPKQGKDSKEKSIKNGTRRVRNTKRRRARAMKEEAERKSCDEGNKR
jgi:hypothetical protein